jgi:hypothetical protein
MSDMYPLPGFSSTLWHQHGLFFSVVVEILVPRQLLLLSGRKLALLQVSGKFQLETRHDCNL